MYALLKVFSFEEVLRSKHTKIIINIVSLWHHHHQHRNSITSSLRQITPLDLLLLSKKHVKRSTILSSYTCLPHHHHHHHHHITSLWHHHHHYHYITSLWYYRHHHHNSNITENLDCSQSPIFRGFVEIERVLPLIAAILIFRWTEGAGVGIIAPTP